MSEHTPITGELREAVDLEPTFCGPDKAMVPQPEFDRICDAIDAVHAGLERENAELRERLAVLDNADENMHDGWSITDELRGWYKDRMFMGNGWQELDNIADRIDAEHEKALNSVDDAYDSGYNVGYDEGFASADDWLAQHEDAMTEHGWVRKDKEHIISHATIEVTPHIDWSRMADELNEFVEIVRGIAGGAE